MRRQERECLDTGFVQAVCNAAEYMVLSMVDGGVPYTVPLNFVLLGDSLYFHCATEGRKLDVLAANPAVSACIVGRADLLVPENGAPCNYSMRYESVILSGTASVVTEPAEQRTALAALVARYGGNGAALEERAAASVRMVRIAVTAVSGKHAHIS